MNPSDIKFRKPSTRTITQIQTFGEFLRNGQSLKNCTLQGLDFSNMQVNWTQMEIEETIFLGCTMSLKEEIQLRQKGAYIYQAPENLPYQPFRSQLYDWRELMQGFSESADNSVDWQIYNHFSSSKYNPSINEALWQRIHDHAIDDALRDLLVYNEEGMTNRRCVGFMGGHSKGRDDLFYLKTAKTAKILAEAGYFIVSGGGPGIMEATNLGAYFAGKEEKDLLQAINILKKAPNYKDKGYHQCALQVLEQYPEGAMNLAIPTWFYGHEPSNLFASHIAKYFSNSIREDTLLAISLYGIVCAPGSAGTTQEIFMDATQNHYGTFNYYSPMIFLGRERYEIETLIYPLLKQLSWGKPYHEQLFLTDEPEEVLRFLQKHPPVKVER